VPQVQGIEENDTIGTAWSVTVAAQDMVVSGFSGSCLWQNGCIAGLNAKPGSYTGHLQYTITG